MSEGREIADYLDDIRDAVTEVEEFTRDMDYEVFAMSSFMTMILLESKTSGPLSKRTYPL